MVKKKRLKPYNQADRVTLQHFIHAPEDIHKCEAENLFDFITLPEHWGHVLQMLLFLSNQRLQDSNRGASLWARTSSN